MSDPITIQPIESPVICKPYLRADPLLGVRADHGPGAQARGPQAVVQLAGEYQKTFDAIQSASDTALKAPPVMIVVCDNTGIGGEYVEHNRSADYALHHLQEIEVIG